MKAKSIVIILVILAGAALYFSKSLRKQTADYVKPHVVSVVGTPEEKAVSVIEEMYKAMEQENLEKTLEYIAPSERDKAKSALQKTFAEYDLTYKVSNAKATAGKDGKMSVSLDLEIRSTGKNKFRNRRETGTAFMQHDKADTYFVSFEAKKIVYLQ